MTSDFIRLTWNDLPQFVNAYRVNGVGVDLDGDTIIMMNVEGQTARAEESPEDVVAMVDEVVNGSSAHSINKAARAFFGQE